jgi:predicted nucleic acid-binding protein
VFNASPIIYLCKSGLAGKLRQLRPSFRLVTSKQVHQEVYLKGIENGVSEANMLKELFDGGVIEVKVPKEEAKGATGKEISSSGIHEGETSVISLAFELNGTAIIDDKRARHVSRILGVRVSGTPAIMIELVKSGIISKDEAKLGVENMVKEGWYCSARVFSEIIRAIEQT